MTCLHQGHNSIEYQQTYELTYQQRFTVLRTTSWYCTINALNSVVGKSVGIELNRPPAGAAVGAGRAGQRHLAAGHGVPARPPPRDAERHAHAQARQGEGGDRHQEALRRRKEVQGRIQGRQGMWRRRFIQ